MLKLESLTGALSLAPGRFEIADNIETVRSALNDRGMRLQFDGKFDEARQCYEEALTLDPDYPHALSNLGSLLKELGRVEEGLNSYRRLWS